MEGRIEATLEFSKLGWVLKIELMKKLKNIVFDNEDKELFLLIKNDTIILHVDHILPRSKGGRDEIDNYQTLWDKYNFDKRNKDKTDLRKIS